MAFSASRLIVPVLLLVAVVCQEYEFGRIRGSRNYDNNEATVIELRRPQRKRRTSRGNLDFLFQDDKAYWRRFMGDIGNSVSLSIGGQSPAASQTPTTSSGSSSTPPSPTSTPPPTVMTTETPVSSPPASALSNPPATSTTSTPSTTMSESPTLVVVTKPPIPQTTTPSVSELDPEVDAQSPSTEPNFATNPRKPQTTTPSVSETPPPSTQPNSGFTLGGPIPNKNDENPSPTPTTATPSEITDLPLEDDESSATPTGDTTTTFPSISPSFSSPSRSTIYELVLSNSPFSGEEFLDASNYQSRALAWLETMPATENAEEGRIIQLYALACIYYATYQVPNDVVDSEEVAGWTVSTGWLLEEDECLWFGLVCNADSRVIAISLESNNLSGAFPPEASLLKETLVDLRLTNNLLHNVGSVFNSFLGQLTNLEVLMIGDTYFENYPGIPTEIGLLTKLVEFECYATMYSGPLDSRMWENMTELVFLDLSFNGFNSRIPKTIASLPKLTNFYIESSAITGDLSYMFGMESLYEHWVAGNPLLQGRIPTFIGNLGSLASFNINNCGLSGTIPSEFGQLENMIQLFLAGNALEGTVPTELGNMKALEILRLHENNLVGTMPDEICFLDDEGALRALTADCAVLDDGLAPSLWCSCCTQCF